MNFKRNQKQFRYLIETDDENKIGKRMAGVLGFEPRDAEIKTRCLTAWRYPKRKKLTIVSL